MCKHFKNTKEKSNMANTSIIKNGNKAKFDNLSNGQAIEVLGTVAQWALTEISKLLLVADDAEKSVLEELKLEQSEAYKISRDMELSKEEREVWYARATKASDTILQIAKAKKVKIAILGGIGAASVVGAIVLSIINQKK